MNNNFILVTGSNGFIGKNLIFNLKTNKRLNILHHNRKDSIKSLEEKINKSSFIIHCAAEVRSNKTSNFYKNNIDLTNKLLDFCYNSNKKKYIIFLSTKKVKKRNNYGITKKKSENLFKLKNYKKIKYQILRLPNIYGKFAKVNHNSVVANYCYKISRNQKIYVSNYNNKVELLYIDNLIGIIFDFIKNTKKINNNTLTIKSDCLITLKELIEIIKGFKYEANINHTPILNNSLKRNLYATYVSYLPPSMRKSIINVISDKRGSFAEIFKNNNFGQISLLEIKPNKTRGNHFHNSKIERFYIIMGKAEFNLINLTNNKKEKHVFKDNNLFEMPPGYLHSIKNIGKINLKILIWSSQIYDRNNSDTFLINNEN